MYKCKVGNLIEESRFGGPQKRMALVSADLSAQHDVNTFIVANSTDNQVFLKSLTDLDIPHTFIPIVRPSISIWSLVLYAIFFVSDIIKIFRTIRPHDFNIVHVSGGSWQVKSLIAARLTRAKVIWHLNDTYVPMIVRIIFKITSRLPHAYIFASYRTKGYYHSISKHVLAKQWSVIPSPIDPALLKLDDPSTVIKPTKINFDQGIKIGCVGNINPVKGFDVLLEACLLIEEDLNIPIKIEIVGNIFQNQRPYYNKLVHMLDGSCIQFNVKQGVTDIRSHLAEVDVFVCSSRYESSPMAVWEALALNCLVVSSDVGDVERYINHSINGFIFKSEDPTHLYEVLKSIIMDAYPIEKIRAIADAEVKKYITLDAISGKTAAFYSQLSSDRLQ